MGEDLVKSCEESIVSTIGEDNWNIFQKTSQCGVVTSEVCRQLLSTNPGGIDFSAAIMPIMKAFEQELIIHFYLPYLRFLSDKKNGITPNKFVSINNLRNRKYNGIKLNPHELRRRIIGRNDTGKYYYRSPYNYQGKIEFTLGDFRFTSGSEDKKRHSCDTTVIMFYKNEYFGSTVKDSDVGDWVFELAEDVYGVSKIRNESAHAGITQPLIEAENTMNLLIKVKKLMVEVANPTLP